MEEDPIMQELRQVRRKLLEEAGGDAAKLLERANREGPILWEAHRKKSIPKSGARKKPGVPAKTGTFRKAAKSPVKHRDSRGN